MPFATFNLSTTIDEDCGID